jgi:hypothetical protein
MNQVLQAEQIRRALLHQASPLAQQVPQRPLLARVDVAFGQHADPQHVRQPTSIGTIVGMLETLVRLHGTRMGQVNPVARIHQAVDQPVPVESRFHRNPDKLLRIG